MSINFVSTRLLQQANDSVAYQMICAVSNYTPRDLSILHEKCSVGGQYWSAAKDEYAEYQDQLDTALCKFGTKHEKITFLAEGADHYVFSLFLAGKLT